MKKFLILFIISAVVGFVGSDFALSVASPAEQADLNWLPYAGALVFGFAGVLSFFVASNERVLLPNLARRFEKGQFFFRMLLGIGLALAVPLVLESFATQPPTPDEWFWIRCAQVSLIGLCILMYLIKRHIALLEKKAGQQDKDF